MKLVQTNDNRIDKYLNDLGFEHESTLSGSSHLRAKLDP